MTTTTLKKNRLISIVNLLDRIQEKQQILSWIIVCLFLLLIYLLLQVFPFPEYKEVSEVTVDEEIFEIFEPKPVPAFQQRLPEKQADAIGRVETPTTEEIAQIFDFQSFEELAGGDDLIQEMDLFADAAGGMDEMLDDMSAFSEGLESLSTDAFLTGDGDSYVSDALSGLKTAGDNQGLSRTEGSGLSSSGEENGRGGVSGEGTGTGRAIGTGQGVAVVFKSYGEDDYHGKDIVDPLIIWMTDHPRDHEYTIRSFLEYKPGDITSIIRFSLNNRFFELYLQVTEETRELSIFIAEGNEFTKLVDQGISKRSHKLETGLIERDTDDGRIVTLFSTQTAPNREKTDDFMSIFLSWWNDGNPAE